MSLGQALTSSAVWWWLRSVNATNTNNFRNVNTSGSNNNNNANNSGGLAPGSEQPWDSNK